MTFSFCLDLDGLPGAVSQSWGEEILDPAFTATLRTVLTNNEYGFYELESTFNLDSKYEPPDTFARHIRGRHNSFHHTKSQIL